MVVYALSWEEGQHILIENKQKYSPFQNNQVVSIFFLLVCWDFFSLL